jgi:hypothetical protein
MTPIKFGILVIKKCNRDNIPSPHILTPHSYGRVIEHTVGLLGSNFSLRVGAKAGDGTYEDPNNALLARILFNELADEVLCAIDTALEKQKYVVPMVGFSNLVLLNEHNNFREQVRMTLVSDFNALDAILFIQT